GQGAVRIDACLAWGGDLADDAVGAPEQVGGAADGAGGEQRADGGARDDLTFVALWRNDMQRPAERGADLGQHGKTAAPPPTQRARAIDDLADDHLVAQVHAVENANSDDGRFLHNMRRGWSRSPSARARHTSRSDGS